VNSKHHRWQAAWTINGREIRHESGLVARVDQAGAAPASARGVEISAAGERWVLEPVDPAVILAPSERMKDPASRHARLVRLMREAAAVWRHQVVPVGRFPKLDREEQ
jgi:hypothetical protein